MRNLDMSDLVGLVGLAMIAGGLAAYDWRLALVVVGTILLAIVLAGAWRK